MMAIVGDTRDADVGRQREAEHLHDVRKETDIAIVPNFMDVER